MRRRKLQIYIFQSNFKSFTCKLSKLHKWSSTPRRPKGCRKWRRRKVAVGIPASRIWPEKTRRDGSVEWQADQEKIPKSLLLLFRRRFQIAPLRSHQLCKSPFLRIRRRRQMFNKEKQNKKLWNEWKIIVFFIATKRQEIKKEIQFPSWISFSYKFGQSFLNLLAVKLVKNIKNPFNMHREIFWKLFRWCYNETSNYFHGFHASI